MSVWSRRGEMVQAPEIGERSAVRALVGVGGDVEWWFWNRAARVGHLRVPVTTGEAARMPAGVALDDAGETGPQRPRTLRP